MRDPLTIDPITLVLLTDPALEFVARKEVRMEKPPGVVLLEDTQVAGVVPTVRVFVYAYQENPFTFCYKQSTLARFMEL